MSSISLKIVCIIRYLWHQGNIPCIADAMHDVVDAICAAGAADVGWLEVEDKSILKSEFMMLSWQLWKHFQGLSDI